MARVLFFGEAVTLAHVARSVVLGEALTPRHDVTLALAPHAHHHVRSGTVHVEPLNSIAGSRFIEALRLGRPVYDEATLERYVHDDLRLIDACRPDLVVGDFRISLSVSARMRAVPYLSVANAYWSPWYERPAPLPVLPWTRFVPLPLGKAAFALARKPAMAAHTKPLNRVRARHGLPSLGRDLRRVYTDADYVAYADVPELFPTPRAPSTHRHIGPILWSPASTPPAWWHRTVSGMRAYVSVGSSGDASLLPTIVAALDLMGVKSMVATAGAAFAQQPASLAQVAPYLPGLEAARRANLVVCNGGSLSVQQALTAGRPVLGIAANMDQFFNMRAIVEAGAGLCIRADRATPRAIGDAARSLLENPAFAAQARHLSAVLARYSAAARFSEMVEGILGANRAGGSRHEKDPAQPDPGVPGAVRDGLATGLGQHPAGP